MQKLFNRTAGKYIAMLFIGARAKQFHKGMYSNMGKNKQPYVLYKQIKCI